MILILGSDPISSDTLVTNAEIFSQIILYHAKRFKEFANSFSIIIIYDTFEFVLLVDLNLNFSNIYIHISVSADTPHFIIRHQFSLCGFYLFLNHISPLRDRSISPEFWLSIRLFLNGIILSTIKSRLDWNLMFVFEKETFNFAFVNIIYFLYIMT